MSPYKKYKSMRLLHYNYSSEGYYFITICTKDRKNIFGKILENKMQLNKYGKIVKRQWLWLEKQYPYVNLDKYIIMPNHFHGIVIINKTGVGAGHDPHLPKIKIKPLTQLIGAFKTTSSKLIHQNGFLEFRWQRSFYDRIIKNEKSLNNIREYIILNPLKWDYDRNNPKNN